MSGTCLAYRVVGWDRRYETRASLQRDGVRKSVSVPTDLGRVELQLLDAPGGAAAFIMWSVARSLAARSSRRGALVDGGVPVTVAELAKWARCSEAVAEESLRLLCSPGIELLEQVTLDEALQPPVIPPARPRKPKKPPPPTLTECPFCHADLTASSKVAGALRDPSDPKVVEITLPVFTPSCGCATSETIPSSGEITNGGLVTVVGESFLDSQRRNEAVSCCGADCQPGSLVRQADRLEANPTRRDKLESHPRLQREFAALSAAKRRVDQAMTKVAAVRDLRQQLERREVTPEAVARLQSVLESEPSRPTPVKHYDDRLKSKKQRRLEQQRQAGQG